MKKKADLLWLAVTALCSGFLFLIPPSSGIHLVCGFLLIYFLPGHAFSRFLFDNNEINFYERICASFGISIAFSCISFLWVYYFFPKVTFLIMGSLLAAAAILGFLLCVFKKERSAKKTVLTREFFLILAVLAIAAFFRLTHLGYSDYQGDEAHYSIKPAIEALQGDKEALITMEKPPTATILPAIEYLFFRTFNETLIRIPFALYGILGVLAMYVLGRQLFNARIGLISAAFASLNGFFIVFSRIAQYQPIIVFSILLSLLFMHKFLREYDFGKTMKYFFLGVFFAGFATFTHYDGVFVLPVLAFIFLCKCFSGTVKKPVFLAVSGAALFCLVTLPFYLPFMLHPNFLNTVRFYQGERFRSFWNFHWPTLKDGGSFYTSDYYFWTVLILSPLSIFRKWKHEMWIMLFWFLPPFIFLMVLCSKPNTHIYDFFVPMCVLSALGIDNILLGSGRIFKNPRIFFLFQELLLLAGIALAVKTGSRVHKLFIRHQPEFLWSRAYDSVPHYGIFGFPYHRGWKTAGYLFRTKKLEGAYNSNEKSKITNYYLKQYPEKDCRYFLVVKNPQTWAQDALPPEGFLPLYQILSQNEVAMTIYEKGAASCTNLNSEEYDDYFDALDRDLPATVKG
jgi:hypothetical protein